MHLVFLAVELRLQHSLLSASPVAKRALNSRKTLICGEFAGAITVSRQCVLFVYTRRKCLRRVGVKHNIESVRPSASLAFTPFSSRLSLQSVKQYLQLQVGYQRLMRVLSYAFEHGGCETMTPRDEAFVSTLMLPSFNIMKSK